MWQEEFFLNSRNYGITKRWSFLWNIEELMFLIKLRIVQRQENFSKVI